MPGKMELASLAWNLILEGRDLVSLSVALDTPPPRPLMLPLRGWGMSGVRRSSSG